MLNFKAYIQCFPAIFGMYRIGDVDYIHSNHKRDDSTVGVVNFMTMYQLDAIFRRAVWDAYKINSENPYAHIAFFFLNTQHHFKRNVHLIAVVTIDVPIEITVVATNPHCLVLVIHPFVAGFCWVRRRLGVLNPNGTSANRERKHE